jgi:hypothetical protein
VSAMRHISAEKRELAVRLALIPVSVLVCYLSEWWQLRTMTIVALLKVSAILNVPMHRSGFNLLEINGMQVQFSVACTMVDAFFGAIPLLWRRSHSLQFNLARLSGVFAGVFALNIFRLELGFAALHYGVPWWLAHECVAGVAYFCVFLFIMHESAWKQPSDSDPFDAIDSSPDTAFA